MGLYQCVHGAYREGIQVYTTLVYVIHRQQTWIQTTFPFKPYVNKTYRCDVITNMTSSLFSANIISSPILLHHNIYKNNNNDNNNRHYDDYEQIQPVASRPALSRWGRTYSNELTLPFIKACWEFTKAYFAVCYNYSTIHPLELTKVGVGKHNQRGSASTISGVELKFFFF